MLEVNGIVKRFAGLTALNGVSFRVQRGELLGLIGPNGAGKSVMVNTISGLYRPNEGDILYKNENITGLRPDLIARKKINRTFQHSTLFFDLPVIENISMGVPMTSEVGLVDAVFKTGSYRRKERRIREEAERIVDLLKLGRHAVSTAGSLPYGLQKVVGIGIALAGGPELLLLDEPLTGLISAEVDEVMGCIDRVNAAGVTVLIIEHNVRAVMSHCNRIVVLDFGAKIAEGTPAEIRRNAEVIKSYLGEAQ
ncbi:MAG: ABC transporter ATP-binding protein [Desulfobacteria bacterium]